MIRRISKSNPYIQTPAQFKAFLCDIDDDTRDRLCVMLGITKKQWKRLPKPLRAKALVDFQQQADVKNTLTAATEAHTRFANATDQLKKTRR